MNPFSLFTFFSFFILNVLGANLATLTVQGSATHTFPADRMQCSIAVVTQGSDAQSALNSNNLKMKEVILAMQKLGLSSSEYSTAQFSIRPLYSQRPKNAPSDWRTTIIGHEVTNRLNVETDQITLTPKLIDAATNSGANSIDNLSFTLKDPGSFRMKVIGDATERAVGDAKALAESANLTLNRIHSISLDDSPTPTGLYYAKAMEGVPLEAGEVEVRASVKIVYELN